MGFFEQEATKGKRTNNFDQFIKLDEKPVTVQILEPKLGPQNVVWKHYIPTALRKSGQRGIAIVCPGMKECPVCAQNTALGDKKHKDYIKPIKSIVVNVLDLTMVKTCPICSTENPVKAMECSECGYVLDEVDAAASGKVRLLERGATLFTQLSTLEETVTKPYNPKDPSNDPEVRDYSAASPGDPVPVGITHFPLTLIISKSGDGQRLITPIPGAPNTVNWREYQDKLINLSEAYIKLTPDEIRSLMRGGSLSEIFKSRRDTGVSTDLEDTNAIPF